MLSETAEAPLVQSSIDFYKVHKEAAVKQFWEKACPLFPGSSDNKTSMLYHYTTLDGFKNIIETGKLWGSNFSYLNDSTELWSV